MYEIQYGLSDKKLIKAAEKSNQALPERIANRPILDTGLEIYWKAFWECSTCRPIGMAEGPIPWTSMKDWALLHGFRGFEFERLLYLLKSLDVVYIEERSAQQDKKMKKISKSSSPSSGSIKTKVK